MIDVNTFVGSSPWRDIPGSGADTLLADMDRLGIETAWVSNLTALYWKDPSAGNAQLYELAARYPRLRAVPAIHPGLPGWEVDLDDARRAGVPAVRCDPGLFALAPTGIEVTALLQRLGHTGLPLLAAVRFEDARGRHPLDVAPELPAWAVRSWLRQSPGGRVIVTNADRAFIEEVHWGSTPQETARIWWDIAWVWGPPEDDLRHLLATIGTSRFLFGSGQPLRIPETPLARLDLLALSVSDRAAITEGNARALLGP